MNNEKVFKYDKICWIHILSSTAIIYAIIITVLASYIFPELYLCCILQINIFIFSYYTYPAFSKELIKYKYSTSVLNLYTYNSKCKTLCNMLEITCKFMNLFNNISIICIIIWFVKYVLSYGIEMYDIKYLICIAIYAFMSMGNMDMINDIFNKKDTWSNPRITPLKHVRKMIEDI